MKNKKFEFLRKMGEDIRARYTYDDLIFLVNSGFQNLRFVVVENVPLDSLEPKYYTASAYTADGEKLMKYVDFENKALLMNFIIYLGGKLL